MLTISLKPLVNKLSNTCRQSLEAAAGLCLSRSNYNVEIEHWLLKLIENPQSDCVMVLNQYTVSLDQLAKDLTASLNKLKTGNTRAPALSNYLLDWIREAWLFASVEFGLPQISSAHLVYTLLSDSSLSLLAGTMSKEFTKIAPEALRLAFPELLKNSTELTAVSSVAKDQSLQAENFIGNNQKTALNQYTQDLTAQARAGKIDPVIGRDNEIRQIIDILTRRRQNNPILTGEAGVGKTAVVEGFALRIAAKDVPPALENVSLRVLDLGLLQAGASMKGEFENRLKNIIDEVKASPQPIILFIDEAHTLIGAGNQAGQGDAANLLKPALARGELRTIAATTWAEYKKYFEKDAALTRRFQVVKVEEPSESAAVAMLRGVASTLASHHGVDILDEAIIEAVRLSHRYIPARQLPDKAVSLLDTACARVAINQCATPPAVEDLQHQLTLLTNEMTMLEAEQAIDAQHTERLALLDKQKTTITENLEALKSRWQQEIALVKQIGELRVKLKEQKAEPVSELQAQLHELTKQLEAIQGEQPLLQVCVDKNSIAQVVAEWTGIPVGRMVTNEIQTILNLQAQLGKRIVGQSYALQAIAQNIRTSRAKLSDPRKPIGVFLMVGTSGVGKTETALALAEQLYGNEQNITVLNMSEYKEEHKVSTLMGSPPGYVGYGEGGVLTEAVRRRPYSIILLDEMEKAHPGIQDVFYQVFDKGMLRDSEGRDVDFKNTIIIMTSNAGTATIQQLCGDSEKLPAVSELSEALRPELLRYFKPAFLGRVSLVPYFPLTDEMLRSIIQLQLSRIQQRVNDNYQAEMRYTDNVIDHIASRCHEIESGARNVDHILTRTLLPELAAEFLSCMADGKKITAVEVSINDSGEFIYAITE